jgi:hypothetical protein
MSQRVVIWERRKVARMCDLLRAAKAQAVASGGALPVALERAREGAAADRDEFDAMLDDLKRAQMVTLTVPEGGEG